MSTYLLALMSVIWLWIGVDQTIKLNLGGALFAFGIVISNIGYGMQIK